MPRTAIKLLKNSPHLLGRNHQVHFPRYYANKNDILFFGQLLQKYSELIKLDSSIESLTDIGELMYGGSLGCIGLLKAWLKRTDAIATIENITISESLLMQTRLTDINLLAISQEIQAGEKLLERHPMSQSFIVPASESGNKKTVRPRKGKKPFQRNPVKYKSENRTNEE